VISCFSKNDIRFYLSTAYCWKCATFVVLMDADKKLEFDRLHTDAVLKVKRFREENGARLEDVPLRDQNSASFFLC
jgi:hypothetical protein